jgi:hypothetical protein
MEKFSILCLPYCISITVAPMVNSKECTAVQKFDSPYLENSTYRCTSGLDQAFSLCSLNHFTSHDIESKYVSWSLAFFLHPLMLMTVPFTY